MILGLILAETALLLAGFLLDQPLLGAAAAAALVYLVLAYRSPDAAWALVWIAFPFSVELSISGGNAMNVPTEPMIALALLAWALRAPVREPLRIPRSSLHAPIAAIGAVALGSVAASRYPLLGLKAWVVAAAYVAFAYVYCFWRIGGTGKAARWIPWVVGLGAFWGLYGAVRVFSEGVSLAHAYGAARPFFPEHGTYGVYLAMILPLALLAALEAEGTRRALYAASSTAIALAIALSFTRAAWVSVVVVLPFTVGVWAWKRRSVKPIAWLAGLAVLVLVVLVGLGAQGRLSTHVASIGRAEDVSRLERVNRWMAAAEMTKDRPWLGVGYGAYPAAYSSYRRKVVLTEMAYQYMGAHSEPLRVLSETGTAGFIASLWLLAAAAAVGIRVFSRARDPRTSLLALAVLSGLATYLVHSVFNSYPGADKVTIPFWASLGVLAALGREVDGAVPSSAEPVSQARV